MPSNRMSTEFPSQLTSILITGVPGSPVISEEKILIASDLPFDLFSKKNHSDCFT